MNATAVRFSFSGLYRKFDLMEISWVRKPQFSFVKLTGVVLKVVSNGHSDKGYVTAPHALHYGLDFLSRDFARSSI